MAGDNSVGNLIQPDQGEWDIEELWRSPALTKSSAEQICAVLGGGGLDVESSQGYLQVF